MSANIDRYGRARTPQNLIPQMPIYHVTPTRHSSSFNDFIVNIGENIQDGYENFAIFIIDKVVPVLLILLSVGAVIGGIVTWVTEGFWACLIYVFVVLLVVGIGAKVFPIVAGLLAAACQIVVYILRLIFTNAITFIITMGVVLSLIIIFAVVPHVREIDKPVTTTQTAPLTTLYVCKASTLNVRSYASSNAPVLGKLRKGDRIEVYSIQNGFAKINYKDRFGYVSEKYITKSL